MDITDITDSINSKFYQPNSITDQDLPSFFAKTVDSIKGIYESINFPLIGTVINIIFFASAVFAIIVICYSAIRMLEVRKREHKHLEEEIGEYAHKQKQKEKDEIEQKGSAQSVRWGSVLRHMASPNHGDWKLAILDADSMLEDLLDQLGFSGESLGEKLKLVDMEKYSALKLAWDVHIIRNKIAHEGIKFEVPEQEAKRVIAIYEQIFRDFRYI